MGEEIFGPILPVLAVDDVDEAVAFVNQRDKPAGAVRVRGSGRDRPGGRARRRRAACASTTRCCTSPCPSCRSAASARAASAPTTAGPASSVQPPQAGAVQARAARPAGPLPAVLAAEAVAPAPSGLAPTSSGAGRRPRYRGPMIPVVTPAEMAAIDAAAPEPVEVLIERAGAAVARAAARMLGGTYGRRVVVLAGKGNNGNDGRAAARRLAGAGRGRARGRRRRRAGPAAGGRPRHRRRVRHGLPRLLDARPTSGDAAVLAVDIPSGVDGRDRRGRRRRPARRPDGDVRRAEAGPAPAAGFGGHRRDRGGGHRARREPGSRPPGDRGRRRGSGCCRAPSTRTSGTPRWPWSPARRA